MPSRISVRFSIAPMHLAERRGWQQLEQGFSINITVVAAVVVIAGRGESSYVPSHHLMYVWLLLISGLVSLIIKQTPKGFSTVQFLTEQAG